MENIYIPLKSSVFPKSVFTALVFDKTFTAPRVQRGIKASAALSSSIYSTVLLF